MTCSSEGGPGDFTVNCQSYKMNSMNPRAQYLIFTQYTGWLLWKWAFSPSNSKGISRLAPYHSTHLLMKCNSMLGEPGGCRAPSVTHKWGCLRKWDEMKGKQQGHANEWTFCPAHASSRTWGGGGLLIDQLLLAIQCLRLQDCSFKATVHADGLDLSLAEGILRYQELCLLRLLKQQQIGKAAPTQSPFETPWCVFLCSGGYMDCVKQIPTAWKRIIKLQSSQLQEARRWLYKLILQGFCSFSKQCQIIFFSNYN